MLSSRPGQSGRADGYILEGAEFEVRRSCLFADSLHCTADQFLLCAALVRHSSTASVSPCVARCLPLTSSRLCLLADLPRYFLQAGKSSKA